MDLLPHHAHLRRPMTPSMSLGAWAARSRYTTIQFCAHFSRSRSINCDGDRPLRYDTCSLPKQTRCTSYTDPRSTSVGAVNAMRDLNPATACWSRRRWELGSVSVGETLAAGEHGTDKPHGRCPAVSRRRPARQRRRVITAQDAGLLSSDVRRRAERRSTLKPAEREDAGIW